MLLECKGELATGAKRSGPLPFHLLGPLEAMRQQHQTFAAEVERDFLRILLTGALNETCPRVDLQLSGRDWADALIWYLEDPQRAQRRKADPTFTSENRPMDLLQVGPFLRLRAPLGLSLPASCSVANRHAALPANLSESSWFDADPLWEPPVTGPAGGPTGLVAVRHPESLFGSSRRVRSFLVGHR